MHCWYIAPLLYRIRISGTFSNVNVVNAPARTFSVSNPGPLVISSVNVDNCVLRAIPYLKMLNQTPFSLAQGDAANSNSGGNPAAKNTDGFDASTTNLVHLSITSEYPKGNLIVFYRRSKIAPLRIRTTALLSMQALISCSLAIRVLVAMAYLLDPSPPMLLSPES